MKERVREIFNNSKRIVPALMLATSLLLASCSDIKPTSISITPLPPQIPTKPLLIPEIKPTLTPKSEVKKNLVNFKFTQGFENTIRPYGVQGELLREIISKTGNRYAERFGCFVSNITIDVANETKMKTLPNGAIEYSADSAFQGTIILPIKDLVMLFTNKDKVILWANLGKEIQDTILHAMGHGCMGPEILLSNKVDIGQGQKAYGYQGLTFLMELANGTKTKFTKVEEGMLEVFALNIEPNYGKKADSYMRLRSISQMIIQKWVSVDEVNKYLKTSDVSGLLQKIYGKPRISNVEIANIIDIYSELFDGLLTPIEAFNELESLRLFN